MAASTVTGDSYPYERRIVRIHRYHWPAIQLNVWMLIMLAASFLIIGVFGSFIGIQQQLNLNVPWYFAYYITVSGLTVGFIILLLWLIAQRRLLPAIVIIGAFVLFVLWLVGLIVISIELWGPAVPSALIAIIWSGIMYGMATTKPRSPGCSNGRYSVFAFGVIGTIFLLWIIVMAVQVFYDDT